MTRRLPQLRVLPPFNGGLHCGAVTPRGIAAMASRCSRRSPAGSIAAAHGSTCDELRPVLPPFNGGLHCGAMLPSPCAPRLARCSRRSTAGSIAAAWPIGVRPVARCSRRSTAGSIAADLMLLPASSASACSRRSTAGSIAARRAVRRAAGRPSRAPAVQRRAPLRQYGCTAPRDARAPAVHGGLHCGDTDTSSRTVLPPINGGLHCGNVARPACSPSGRRAPADQRRAPLRRERRRRLAAFAGPPVLPPFNGGLHCGHAASTEHAIAARRVLPPFNGGLHCGSCHRHPRRPEQAQVLPPFNGGLHCGTAAAQLVHVRAQRCSRRSTAGSIAAQARCSAVRAGTCVLPPFNGGLHCGDVARHVGDRRADGAPAVQRRAPLRQLVQPLRLAAAGCSRRSTAGSIAARRSRPRGVIAGAPASQRRAPLRHGRSEQRAAPIECSRRSAAGSIAAARDDGVADRTARVLPPFNGGLHCGSAHGLAAAATDRAGAPAVHRRAPLRPALNQVTGDDRCSHCQRTAGSIGRP